MKRHVGASNRVYCVCDKILIFSLFVGCFYRKGPALNNYRELVWKYGFLIATRNYIQESDTAYGQVHKYIQPSVTCI